MVMNEMKMLSISLSFLCSNHSWVSFQGFAEAYNDTFQLPKALGKLSLNKTSKLYIRFQSFIKFRVKSKGGCISILERGSRE